MKKRDNMQSQLVTSTLPVGASMVRDARDAPRFGPISSIFIQVSRKKLLNNKLMSLPLELAPFVWEVLDLRLDHFGRRSCEISAPTSLFLKLLPKSSSLWAHSSLAPQRDFPISLTESICGSRIFSGRNRQKLHITDSPTK